MLHILEVTGIVIVVLILNYLLCLRFPRVGDAQAFICVLVVRLLVKIQWACEHAATYVDSLFERSLRFPPGVPGGECFAGIAVVARLIYLTVSALIFLGETDNTLLAQSALWQTATTIQLGGVGIASAALFLCTSALFGAVLLETVGLIPASASLFVPMGKRVRLMVGILAGLFTVVSLLVVSDFYLFRGVYLLNPDSAQPMTLLILSGLGLITAAASIISLWGIVVGLCGVFTVVCWIVAHGLEGLALLSSLLPSLFDVLAVHLSDGRWGVYHDLHPASPYQLPAPFFNGHTFRNKTVLSSALPEPSGMVQAPGDLLPEKVKEETMKHPYKAASLIMVGSLGSRMFPLFKAKIDQLEAAESVLTSGLCDLSVSLINPALPGIIDISPKNGEKQGLHTVGEHAAYETLLKSLGERVVEVHLQTNASPAPLLFVIDKQCLAVACPLLEEVKRRLPLHTVFVLTSIVQADLNNVNIRNGLQAVQALPAQNVLETIIVLDARSPFALTYGEETGLEFTAEAVVSLFLTHKHTLNNRTFHDLLKNLHAGSAFTTFSFASEPLALGNVPARLSFLPGVKQTTGMGDFGDIVTQIQEAVNRCVHEENCRAFPAPVASSSPAVVVVDTPIKISDRRFTEIASATSRFANATYPFLTCTTVSGNGCTYPTDRRTRFVVQASCLYHLPDILPSNHSQQKPMLQLLSLPSSDTVEPPALNGNGHKNGASHASSSARTPRRSRKTGASATERK